MCRAGRVQRAQLRQLHAHDAAAQRGGPAQRLAQQRGPAGARACHMGSPAAYVPAKVWTALFGTGTAKSWLKTHVVLCSLLTAEGYQITAARTSCKAHSPDSTLSSGVFGVAQEHLQSAARMLRHPEHSQRSCSGLTARGGATLSGRAGQGRPAHGGCGSTGHQARLPSSCAQGIH